MQDLLVSDKGSIRDKLRLLGVYCLAIRPSTAEVTELENLLKQSAASSGDMAQQEAERGLGAIGYLRQQVGRRGRQIFSSWVFPCWLNVLGRVRAMVSFHLFVHNARYKQRSCYLSHSDTAAENDKPVSKFVNSTCTASRFHFDDIVADILAALANNASGRGVRRGPPVRAEPNALWAFCEGSYASNGIAGQGAS